MDADSPVFAIAVAAELAGMHPQTLRQYDRIGLVVPGRTRGGSRRYSMHDIEQLREVAQLSSEERNVLRMHHVHGLSLEETASACHIGRSTAARWLAQARERIMKETHRLLTAKLNLDSRDVESMFRLVRSQLDVSLHRYLEENS